MLEAVLDTNVLVAALRSQRGAAFLLLEGLQKGLWRLRPLSADPNDEHVIELALKTKRPIITFNRRDFVVVTTMGLERFTPAEWLVKLIER